MPVNYSNGKIYKVFHVSNSNEIYVGSTAEKLLSRRMSHHKSQIDLSDKLHCRMRETDWKDWRIELIESFSCKNKDELRMKEQYWINEIKPFYNSMRAFSTNEEILQQTKKYRQENRKKILQQTKKYRQEHKEEIKQISKQYYGKKKDKIKQRVKEYYQKNKDKYMCLCCRNLFCYKKDINKHFKSKKHFKQYEIYKSSVEQFYKEHSTPFSKISK
jgi:hypothetical protein